MIDGITISECRPFYGGVLGWRGTILVPASSVPLLFWSPLSSPLRVFLRTARGFDSQVYRGLTRMGHRSGYCSSRRSCWATICTGVNPAVIPWAYRSIFSQPCDLCLVSRSVFSHQDDQYVSGGRVRGVLWSACVVYLVPIVACWQGGCCDTV